MSQLLTSLRLFALTIVACCVVYPALVLGFASVAAPEKRQGSLIHDRGGNVIGSRLIAQKFTQPRYFWPRPSAVDYNAAGAGGSNLSPANPALTERAAEIIDRLQLSESELVPADLVAASGSGLDPHITWEAAVAQMPRVAAARGLDLDELRQRAAQRVDSTLEPLGGGRLINVLELNLALDGLSATP